MPTPDNLTLRIYSLSFSVRIPLRLLLEKGIVIAHGQQQKASKQGEYRIY